MGVTSELPRAEQSRRSRSETQCVPAYWRCGVAISVAWLTLRVVGFARTLRAARSLAERHGALSVDAGAVRQIGHRVAVVAAFFPGRALCLEQSLALYWLLRRRGAAARLRVGVHPAPFMAHAWVEYGGAPINEDEDRIRELLPLPIDAVEPS
jgi:hypothetical protein